MTTNEWLVTALIVFACIAVKVGLFYVVFDRAGLLTRLNL
jgi:hypothetical protein